MRAATCNAIGCAARILENELFCRRCYPMVESDTIKLCAKTFRPGARRQSATFAVHLARAQREILNFKTMGHHAPKDRPFMWDEV
jgi:hypothetical protein